MSLALLHITQTHTQYHGINVKTCYADFDRHNRGFVSAHQVRLLGVGVWRCVWEVGVSVYVVRVHCPCTLKQ